MAHLSSNHMSKDDSYEVNLHPFEGKLIALPSIRQAIPELQLTTPTSSMSSKYTNLNHISNCPQPTHSTSAVKRRRLSQEGVSWSSSSFSRFHSSPEQSHQHLPPTKPQQRGIHHSALLPTLPSIAPSYNLERGPSNPLKRSASEMLSEGTVRTYRATAIDENQSHIPPKSPYQASRHYDTPYNPTYYISTLSSSPNHYYEHVSSASSSSTSSSNPHYGENRRYSESGVMAMGSDTKMRKRGQNLPKESKVKLNSWFVAHLHHPYPTEDEKQELMRETGLERNQIQNWFINARRRQLPIMIKTASLQVETVTQETP